MLIITADDFGKDRQTTDSILKCFSNQRITSASVMVFMKDSERASLIALGTEMELGLHLNYTLPFDSNDVSPILCEHQNKVISYLVKHKLTQVIYNPFLAKSFNFLFLAQQDEFIRLYGKPPDFINGHHHMHLCANMLVSSMIPKDTRLRRTFTFDQGEKNPLNLIYRRMLDKWISRKFISTDSFYSILPIQNQERLQKIINRANKENIEIEVHPENTEEIEFLLSDQFKSLIETVPVGCFRNL